ncbi:MAG: transglutaminase domain protein [Frankiales bacterium]|nr:transglutaminase domain protein [Frankiales bacterium]
MSIKEQLTLAAGVAVALAMTALFPIYEGSTWLGSSLGAILVVVVSGLLQRRLGVPRPLQPLISLVVLAAYLLVVFTGDTLSAGVVPTGATGNALQAFWDQAQNNIEHYGPPVPTSRGLVLLTAAGVGAVALVVDLVAVVLDRAAVAGLPLLVLLAVPSAVLPKGIGGLPFVLGAIGWLGLLLVEGSERVGRWGTPMRSALPGARPGGDDSSLGRTGRRIGVAAVGAAVLVPWIVPGLDHRLVGGGAGSGGSGGKGGAVTTQTYNPITRLSGQLNRKDKVSYFAYVTDDPQPDYLRMTTLDTYENGIWKASDLKADPKKARVRGGIPLPSGESGAHQNLTMNVAMNKGALDVHWLPVPYGPKKVNVDVSWLWESRSQTVFSAGSSTKDLEHYKVEASRVVPSREDLLAATLDEVPDDIASTYRAPVTVDARVTALADNIVKAKSTEYDQVVALQDYFARNPAFKYDTTVPAAAPGQDPLVAFLQNKRGFCEQYATAMAVMLRVEGIPSRVAVGFTAGEKTASIQDGKPVYQVTSNEAHAWPEAWFAGTGWVRFEPTPRASDAFIPSYSDTAAVPQPGVNPSTGPGASATAGPRPTATISAKNLRDLEAGDNGATPAAAGKSTATSSPALWAVVPVALAVLLVLPLALTFLRRRFRWADAGPLTAWQQLVDDATDVGWTWRDADSPRAAVRRLVTELSLPSSAQESLQRIAGATERARYAPPERQAREDLSAEVAGVRSALQAQASRTVRMRALLFAPSTLRWAVGSVGEQFARIMDAVDDTISAITRPIRRAAAR